MAFFDRARQDPYAAGISWLSSVWLFSSINAVLFFFADRYFVVGLVMTQLLLALPVFTTQTAIVLIVVLLGVLIGCWYLARKGKAIGLLVAALIYLADLIALIAIGLLSGSIGNMVLDFGFHVVALVMMIRGFIHGVKAKAKMQSNWMIPESEGAGQDDQTRMGGM